MNNDDDALHEEKSSQWLWSLSVESRYSLRSRYIRNIMRKKIVKESGGNGRAATTLFYHNGNWKKGYVVPTVSPPLHTLARSFKEEEVYLQKNMVTLWLQHTRLATIHYKCNNGWGVYNTIRAYHQHVFLQCRHQDHSNITINIPPPFERNTRKNIYKYENIKSQTCHISLSSIKHIFVRIRGLCCYIWEQIGVEEVQQYMMNNKKILSHTIYIYITNK